MFTLHGDLAFYRYVCVAINSTVVSIMITVILVELVDIDEYMLHVASISCFVEDV